MPDKILYCSGCSLKIAILVEGSKIRHGAVVLCESCERKRIASDLGNKSKGYSMPEGFDDIFGGIFGGKK